ncbi:tetratricopeptide repeat protein [filamentous cyanobacterium LEGE 11480]|uniref:Tetratricopeptide repeat protein n=1 Tax=Romeriopsis navalis LEGE 11480 TaxID=2777977 RepID=A0A928VQH0_9CYAN|nr:tetratricopeptide repeat protein [Romeriopsis navalis]MBE9031061.1 tetratricopeptide repeat protein [Romeriopsis navalis LEGE 11480]
MSPLLNRLALTTIAFITISSFQPYSQTAMAQTYQTVKQSQQFFKRGNKLYKRGKFAAAATAFQQAKQLHPTFDHAYSLGMTYLNSLQNAKAIPVFREAIQLEPNHRTAPFAYSHIGKAYLNLRQYAKAIAAYQQATIRLPKNTYFHENLGIAYHLNGQFPQAVRAYEQALKLKPNNPDIRKVLEKARTGRKP